LKIIGIDPGCKGCIVELDSETRTARCLDLPYRTDKIINFFKVNDSFDFNRASMIYLEHVKGRGGWGATQVFTFGTNYGQVLGFLYDKQHTLLNPKEWQKIAHFGCFGDNPKLKSWESFQKLNPNSKIGKTKDGLIDAFHIARYGLFYYHAQFKDDWKFERL
jgi:hypothetical protein